MPVMEWNKDLNKWAKECCLCKTTFFAEGASWDEGQFNMRQHFSHVNKPVLDNLSSSCRECDNHNRAGRVPNGRLKGEMLSEQGNKCAICSLGITFENRSAVIDHDHTTGIIRGILCNKCNQGLGSFKDNVKFLQGAIAYLIMHKGEP